MTEREKEIQELQARADRQSAMIERLSREKNSLEDVLKKMEGNPDQYRRLYDRACHENAEKKRENRELRERIEELEKIANESAILKENQRLRIEAIQKERGAGFLRLGASPEMARELVRAWGDVPGKISDPERFFRTFSRLVEQARQEGQQVVLQRFLKDRPEIKAGCGGDSGEL